MARSRAAYLVGIGGALVFPAAVACNSLIGLDDYNHAECTGLTCNDGGTTPDTWRPQNDGGDLPDVRFDATGTQPVSWAAWPMPNYDAGDAGGPNPLTYQKGNGEVKDVVTGLVWQDPPPAGTHMLAQAKEKCSGTWRLPSRIELVTLIDNSRAGAHIDPVAFSATQEGKYWTSSPVRLPPPAPPEPRYWSVNFSTGALDKIEATGSAAVRCVKVGK